MLNIIRELESLKSNFNIDTVNKVLSELKGKIIVDSTLYEDLVFDTKFLQCLEELHVDSWEGYGQALATYRGLLIEDGIIK